MSTCTATSVAFETFLSGFCRELTKYFARRRAREAEDMAQAVVLTLWQHRHTYDPAKGSLRTWGYVIARREYAHAVRRSVRLPLVLDVGHVDPDSSDNPERTPHAKGWIVTDPVTAIDVARHGVTPRRYPKKAAAKRRTPEELAIVARVRELRAAGHTFREVTASLRADGIVSRRGRPYALATICQMEAAS